MPIKTIDENLCIGCGDCVASCPMDVIRMTDGEEKAYIAYPGDCMVCFNCERDCPCQAIYVSPERAHPIPLPW